jgi:hypothetical protein
MILVGGLVTAAGAGFIGWRDEASGLRRFSALTLFCGGGLPGWIIMRIGAEWTYSKEHLSDLPSFTWLDIGYITADGGGVLLLVALVLGGIGVRLARSGGGSGLLRASTVLAAVALAAYVVAVWAMGGKPD